MTSGARVAIIALLVLGVGYVFWYRNQNLPTQTAVAQEPLHAAIITGGDGPYWQLVRNGAVAAAEELDAQVDVMMPKDEDLEGQTQLITSVKRDKYNGLGVSPLDADGQTALINRLSEGMSVVTLDSDAPLANRATYIGASNVAAGQQAAMLIREALPDGGKILVLMANKTKQNNRERREGFEEQLNAGDADGGEIEIVDFVTDAQSREATVDKLATKLSETDGLDGLVGMNAQHGEIMLKAIDEAGASDLQVVAFDAEEATLKGIESGDIFGAVAQDPFQYGYQTVRLIDDFRRRDSANLPLPGAAGSWTVPTKIIRQENLEEFRKSLDKNMQPQDSPAMAASN